MYGVLSHPVTTNVFHDIIIVSADTDDCSSDKCGKNGTCIDLVNSYKCICNPGYTGSDCHSVCDDEPCFNNGTCALCEEGECYGTGLVFMCTCISDNYGALCTDSKYELN